MKQKEFGSIPTMFLSGMPLFNVNTTKKQERWFTDYLWCIDQIRT